MARRVRVKVMKQVAPPLRFAGYSIMYGQNLSKGSILIVDFGANKSGAWFTYEGERLGQR